MIVNWNIVHNVDFMKYKIVQEKIVVFTRFLNIFHVVEQVSDQMTKNLLFKNICLVYTIYFLKQTL